MLGQECGRIANLGNYSNYLSIIKKPNKPDNPEDRETLSRYEFRKANIEELQKMQYQEEYEKACEERLFTNDEEEVKQEQTNNVQQQENKPQNNQILMLQLQPHIMINGKGKQNNDEQLWKLDETVIIDDQVEQVRLMGRYRNDN